MQNSPYLIDWLTLRFPLGRDLGEALTERIRGCLNHVTCCDAHGEIIWESRKLDVDALRSDSMGLFWTVQGDGKFDYLVIGGSPASVEHGINVFGSCDIQHCARVLVREASRQLKAVLPDAAKWQCRRIDVTGNFVLPDFASVKQALRQLCLADGGRRKATNKNRGGDSVYWNPSSDLVKGKAYHKGPHLAHLERKGKISISSDLLALADRVLRLEHTRGAKWFRRLEESGRHWWSLTTEQLEALFVDFFGRVVDGVEVREMERHELVARIAQCNGITEGRASAAFTTYRNIRADGFEVVKDYMAARTFYLHLKYLRAAGISDADLQQGNVVQFRPVRIVLAQPVTSWDDIRRAA
ncbi:phage/plasmid replication protein, II/X family [Azonexus sp.]|uniref:phage/plasmid replication protein, II/X family n=1 Tax=Azonexus sp. TaxID=1872668 RepID=UPI0035B0982C